MEPPKHMVNILNTGELLFDPRTKARTERPHNFSATTMTSVHINMAEMHDQIMYLNGKDSILSDEYGLGGGIAYSKDA